MYTIEIDALNVARPQGDSECLGDAPSFHLRARRRSSSRSGCSSSSASLACRAPHAGHAGHHDPPGAAVGAGPGSAARAPSPSAWLAAPPPPGGGRPAWRTRPPPASRAAETRFAPPRRSSPSVAPSSRLSDEEGGLGGEGGGLRHCEPCLSAWCSRFLPQHGTRACASVPRDAPPHRWTGRAPTPHPPVRATTPAAHAYASLLPPSPPHPTCRARTSEPTAVVGRRRPG